MPSDIFLWIIYVSYLCKGKQTGTVHDVRLVDGGNSLPVALTSIVEGVARYTLRSFPGNKLDGLHNTIDNLPTLV